MSFLKISANFGGCYGCAIGFSITAFIEILYWIFIKPFGLPQEKCSDKNCTKHHYPSRTHKYITRLVQGSATIALLFFICFRFYGVCFLYLNPPIPEETRNQIRMSGTEYGIMKLIKDLVF